MKDRPIIFSSDSVRAVLDGRKTQTRRIIKPQPVQLEIKTMFVWRSLAGDTEESLILENPYGQPGDRLWVRETWGLYDTEPQDGPDNATIFWKVTDLDIDYLKHQLRYQKWCSPIYMPRWASRITLEILGVRVERLQDIGNEDCLAEGIKEDLGAPRIKYHFLWDRLNAKRGYPWSSNPWVWVIEFKKVD